MLNLTLLVAVFFENTYFKKKYLEQVLTLDLNLSCH